MEIKKFGCCCDSSVSSNFNLGVDYFGDLLFYGSLLCVCFLLYFFLWRWFGKKVLRFCVGEECYGVWEFFFVIIEYIFKLGVMYEVLVLVDWVLMNFFGNRVNYYNKVNSFMIWYDVFIYFVFVFFLFSFKVFVLVDGCLGVRWVLYFRDFLWGW